MPVSVVVGGQYGSEGKGKVSAHFARKSAAAAVIRVGGPNSGHSAIDAQGHLVTLRQLPAGAVNSNARVIIPAGSFIDIEILLSEIARLGLSPDRVRIDARASLVTAKHTQDEANSELGAKIGSTTSGTGAALIERISRLSTHLRAKDAPQLAQYIENDTSLYLRSLIRRGERIIIEGTQGFGLSLWHSYEYPFSTSRDTTAANFVAESGLAPHDVDEVILVLRSFPIRVGGNSGPLTNEISWAQLSEIASLPGDYVEYTSATHRVRRIARFDPDIVRRAISSNSPHKIVLNHMDYIDPDAKAGNASLRSIEFVQRVEREIGQRIDLLGYGPDDLIASSTLRLRQVG